MASAVRVTAAALADTLGRLSGRLEGSLPLFELDDNQRFALLRATDHLRNRDHGGAVIELRDRLVNGWTPYRLRHIRHPFDGNKVVVEFTSYSGPYKVDDRLVAAVHDVFRVVEVRKGDPEELVVEDWLPTSETLPQARVSGGRDARDPTFGPEARPAP